MRIDRYLNLINILKSRTLAKEACEKGYVYLNDVKVKASKEIKEGDEISINFPLREIKIKVLKIPAKKNISKKDRKNYFIILKDEKKEII